MMDIPGQLFLFDWTPPLRAKVKKGVRMARRRRKDIPGQGMLFGGEINTEYSMAQGRRTKKQRQKLNSEHINRSLRRLASEQRYINWPDVLEALETGKPGRPVVYEDELIESEIDKLCMLGVLRQLDGYTSMESRELAE